MRINRTSRKPVKKSRLFFYFKLIIMKKFRFALPAFALILAIAASSFTTHSKKAATVTSLHWFNFLGTTQQYDGLASKEEEMDITGCQDETEQLCARGYTEEQLIDGAPEKGPINVNVFTATVFKSEQ
jgi:hypothetical protein